MNTLLLLTLAFVLIIIVWALFGKGDKVIEKENEDNSPDMIFRKRDADKEIEKKYPDSRLQQKTKKDKTEDDDEDKDDDEANEELELPYSADEIISDTSRFRIYKRTLINSEIYAKRGDLDTATNLYTGVNSRINDENTNKKIKANIEYLKKYRENHLKKKDSTKHSEKSAKGSKTTEIKISIDGPMDGPLRLPDNIQFGAAAPTQNIEATAQLSIESVADEVTRRLTEKDLIKSRNDESSETLRQEIEKLRNETRELMKFKNNLQSGSPVKTETGNVKMQKNLLEQETLGVESEPAIKISSDNIIGRGAEIDRSESSEVKKLRHEADELIEQVKPGDISGRDAAAGLPKDFEIQDFRRKLDTFTKHLKSSGEYSPENIEDKLSQIDDLNKGLEKLKDASDEYGKPGTRKISRDAKYDSPIPATLRNAEAGFPKESDMQDLKREVYGLREQVKSGDISGKDLSAGLPKESDIQDLRRELDAFTEHLKSSGEYSPENIEDKLSQIDDLNKGLEKLNKKLKDSSDEHGKAGARGLSRNAKYDSPIPVTLDPKTTLEILGNMPGQVVPDPKVIDFSDFTSQSGPGRITEDTAPKNFMPHPKREAKEESRKDGKEAIKGETRQDTTEKKESIKDADEEFELYSDYGQDPDDATLTDEDIFSKILEETKEEEGDSIEIIGDKKKDAEFSYDLSDKDFDKKKQSDSKFYEKFLKHDKRKKKELPILKVTYSFTRLPDEFSLSRDTNILEYSFYKYKPMLEKANELIKRRMVRDAINYYKVVMAQSIPPEFKSMIRKNINDLTDYLEKYLASG